MNILNNTQTAEWILSLAFQSICVMLLGWFGLKIFKNKSAPLRSWISFLAIMTLLLVPFFQLISIPNGVTAWESQFPISNEITIEVNSGPQIVSKHGVSLAQLPSYLVQQLKSFFSGWNLIRMANGWGFLWVLGFLFFLGRLLYGAFSLHRFKAHITEITDARISKILEATKQSFPKPIRTKIFISSKINSPISMGFFRSFIVFPEYVYSKLSDSEIKGVLLHELSHIYHHDQLAGLIQRLAAALNWWNPLVYALSADYSCAREEISDNHVLRENNSREYAECLINLAETTSLLGRMPVLTGLASPHIPLKDRVNKILSKERIMETQLKKKTAVLLVSAAVVLLAIVVGNRVSFASIEEDVLPDVTVYSSEGIVAQAQEKEKKPPVRAKDDIKPPKLIKMVDPVYPEEARKEGIEGVVIVEATTDVYGRVVDLKVLRSIPELNEAAIAAIKQWIYESLILAGEPRGVIFTVTCSFKLGDKGKKQPADAEEKKGKKKFDVAEKEVKDPSSFDKAEKDKKPRLIKKVDPIYPDEARKAGVEGTVTLEATTDIYGKVEKIKVLKSDDERLSQAAVTALKQWVYEPYIFDTKPQGVEFTVTIRFKLRDKKKK